MTEMAQQENIALQEGHDASDDLIYHITHDLRAPIRALTLLPDWIEEDFNETGTSMPTVIGTHLDTIREQTQLLDRMIVDLREFSRIGRMSDPHRRIGLEDTIGSVAASLPNMPQYSLGMQLEVPSVIGPSNDIQMLFRCLLTNCLQHHDRDVAQISVCSRSTDAGIEIDVADDGPGVEPQYREHAFAMMTTLYRRDDGAGAGIGLALARRIVENVGGTIAFVDNPTGQGACVRIALPPQLEPVGPVSVN